MANESTLIYKILIAPLRSESLDAVASEELDTPDRRDGRIYDYDSRLQLAVEVALATGRPLLLRGDPGSGKSSVASFIARTNHRYYEAVITGQSSAHRICCGDTIWSTARPMPSRWVRERDDRLRLRLHRARRALVVFDRSSARRGWTPLSAMPQPREAAEPNRESMKHGRTTVPWC